MDYFYIYVLRSIEFERNYVGFTRDTEKRLKEHNSGKTKSTRPYKPWRILFYERFSTKAEALRREKFLKTGQGRDYIKKQLAS
jgi:putative endonuclease